ncbi:VMAP-C domain-containing protein [Amycolatopsis sp. CA-230715]|uniref:VMAP-C domain-containing protein n=1 Tax=Amycolatopsis sp. CA-230715 TaxID=2745196 RepID=UPI001C036579|nr:hypothetical protein [Amycolatopsis sp. CA-230715]QWF80425.1 hypothetical protein HUW46_03846 [Amycolatopsis sp. CA-230715]
MTQPTPTLYRTIVVVDVAGFTAPDRSLPDRLAVRQGMYEVLKTAFAESDVDFDSCATEDRGDGALVLLPSGTPKSIVADRLPDRITVALRRYNWTRTAQAQIRLRVSLNSGDVLNDGKGWVGEAVDTAFRILDAPRAKEVFAESGRMVAVISSERFFDEVIAPDPGLLPESYAPITVKVKTFTGTAYLRLLGEIAAPVPAPRTAPAEPGGAVLDVIPSSDLTALKQHLALTEVPQLALLVSRALGPATSLPPLNGIDNAWNAFELLTDYNAGPDGVPPAVTFLHVLAEQLGGERGALIRGWVGDQARQLRIGPVLTRKELDRPIPRRAHLHLLIMLEPVSADPARCTLAFWRQDDPDVWPPVLGGVREIGIDEIEYRVDDVILAAEEVWSDQGISAAVEFLLPRALINLPVQRWAKEHATGQPQLLRYGYRVVLRSLERMRAKHWHRAWHIRWDSMLANPSADRLHYSGYAESEEFPIEAALSDEHWVGMVMAKPPSPQREPSARSDEFTSALRSGLPVILWHEEASQEELHALLDWVLATDSGFIDLPERRKMANSSRMAVPFENSLAHDLVVLWDDPNRVIVLDQPLAPAVDLGSTLRGYHG